MMQTYDNFFSLNDLFSFGLYFNLNLGGNYAQISVELGTTFTYVKIFTLV